MYTKGSSVIMPYRVSSGFAAKLASLVRSDMRRGLARPDFEPSAQLLVANLVANSGIQGVFRGVSSALFQQLADLPPPPSGSSPVRSANFPVCSAEDHWKPENR